MHLQGLPVCACENTIDLVCTSKYCEIYLNFLI
jgi:hypothetical protein